MAKKYIAKEEITTYTINTIEIVAETENEAMEILRDSRGKLLDTEIQEEKLNQRWIDLFTKKRSECNASKIC